MGLFDKKFCDVCGNKIGLLGNRKLEDGNLCKECAAKLSPWFHERKASTVEEIKQQLDYREKNKEAVASFNVTRTLGKSMKVLLDEDKQKFMVTRSNKLSEANPDVIDFSQVTGCNVDIDEGRTELYKKDPEGHSVSYQPQRYQYYYDFYVTINVNSPYFNEIKFQINDSSVDIEPLYVQEAGRPGPGGPGGFGGPGGPGGPGGHGGPGGQGGRHPMPRPQMGGGHMETVPSTEKPDPTTNVEYNEYVEMANEIKAALTEVRNQGREAKAAIPKVAVLCPSCGGSSIPDENGCCQYCGAAVVNLK